MKLLISLLFLVALPAHSASFLMAWKNNPPEQAVIGYRIYEQIGTNWVYVAFTPTNNMIVPNISPGWHIYSITATNGLGDSTNRLPQNAIMPAVIPTDPTNISIITIRASIESSESPTGPWRDFANLHLPYYPNTTTFFRAKMGISQ